jgi:hypothetical protein
MIVFAERNVYSYLGKINVVVFDGFMMDCFENLINTAGCPLQNYARKNEKTL